uniref:GATA-type domain-containing protein n=1 Tax=Meloidogyne enterolobii TaxID=390850 RepID=A0A6V7XR84_MELEN|nr:unnamed protein product [Meloidogyne enterolobii]
MIKFIIIYIILYLNIYLYSKCNGRAVNVGVKIKNDWEEKREFIYLKIVEMKERFILIKNVNRGKKIENYFNRKTESFNKIEIDPVEKVFVVKLNHVSKYSSQLKRRILIEIANNETVNKFLKNLGKQIRINNNFIANDNYYETSILEESLENINKKELLKVNIEKFKDNLLSSYWTEINLIGYKIELSEKQKVEYPEDLKNIIVYIGNNLSGYIDENKRNCFNCGVKNVNQWDKYFKKHYLCHVCYNYKRRYAKFRYEEMWFKSLKVKFSIFFNFSKFIERSKYISGVAQLTLNTRHEIQKIRVSQKIRDFRDKSYKIRE